MCGRYTLRVNLSEIAKTFHVDIDAALQLAIRYNIAPTQNVPVVRSHGDHREFAMLHWGLIPSWAKTSSFGNRTINARSETVDEKPAYRAAFKRRRCLVLADGYYEWQKTAAGKQPFFMHMRDDRPFAFAGLWERWEKGPAPIGSCTIITTSANRLTAEIHDRMPAILSADDYDAWLDGEFEGKAHLKGMLRPYEEDDMIATPVSRHVNSPKNDDAQCIREVRELF